MKKLRMLAVVLAVVVLAVLVASCNWNAAVGTITIVSVVPAAGLTGGNPTDFTVEVDYSLSGSAKGELNVGFNTNSKDAYTMISSEKVTISEGTGNHVFTCNGVLPKDWSGVGGEFKAYVNIAEYPHGSIYLPLDTDYMVLTF